MQPIRIFFEKTGSARFISHLDLVRVFGRSLRRAQIPFWYTEGFNPHPFMTFASPLSLGTIGLNESVDIKLTEDISADDVVSRLNTALPAGLLALRAAEPVRKPTELAFSSYELRFEGKDRIFADMLADFFAQESITAQKKNKKKQLVEVDIKSALRDVSISTDEAGVTVTLLLPSGCTENLNPSLVLDALASFSQQDDIECLITRTGLLCADMKEFA